MALADRTALEIFRTIAGEFSDQDESVVNSFLEVASLWVNAARWGVKYNTGLAYMAAHLMATGERGSASGSVTSERVGNVAVNYSAPTSDDLIATTGYGSTFLALRRTLALTPFVSG